MLMNLVLALLIASFLPGTRAAALDHSSGHREASHAEATDVDGTHVDETTNVPSRGDAKSTRRDVLRRQRAEIHLVGPLVITSIGATMLVAAAATIGTGVSLVRDEEAGLSGLGEDLVRAGSIGALLGAGVSGAGLIMLGRRLMHRRRIDNELKHLAQERSFDWASNVVIGPNRASLLVVVRLR